MKVRSSLLVRVAVTLASVGALAFVAAPAAALMSVERPGRVGVEPNGPSSGGVPSADGACVAFYSDATNLLPQGPGGDNNGFTDVFVADRTAGTLSLVSVGAGGESANGPSMAQGFRPSIDADCTCVAFSSDATNLVAGDTNRRTDVFVRLLEAGTTELASMGLDGPADGGSSYASVSGDCGRVAFQSTATNLVTGDANRRSDIFVFDRAAGGAITRVSVGAGGAEANGSSVTPSISADGRCVAFASSASNLWPDDTNGVNDIYVACEGQITCRASVSSDGVEADAISFHPALSADGNIVAFKSEATNLVAGDFNRQPDVFVHDCSAGTTQRVSVSSAGGEGNDISIPPSLSDDGKQVAFGSFASNLIPGKATGGRSQIYVRDLTTGETLLISADPNGNPANGSSPDIPPSITRDGKWVVFTSLATNLVPGDTNGYSDVFISSVGEPEPPTPTPTPTPQPIPCSLDQDCPAGQVCGPDGICIKAPTPTPTIPCQTDDDCPEGLVCIGNVCTDPSTPTPTPTPLPTCEMDEDCLEGFVCRAGVCVPRRECETGLECRGDRETCLNFFCECGGDCNLNGLVFGIEISRMMCQLGGACSIEECEAGDINRDGQVTGCEVSLAVRNLGLGCPGEGVPLVFGEQRISETRTINIGSATGAAGQFVDIAVSLEGGGEVTTAHTDVLIPFNQADITVTELESGELRPNCELDPRLQGTFFPEIRLPQQPRNPEGIRRLRLAEVDIDPPFPLDFFDAGPLFSCRFRIGAGETAGTVIPLMGDPARTEVGDFNAQPFNSVVSDGAITVIDIPCDTDEDCPQGTKCIGGMCRPDVECDNAAEDCLERQACVDERCACAVDCNGDGEVFANEILLAIRVFGGVEDLASCPAADINDDSEVFGNEILIGIQNFGLGCP